MRQMGPAFCWTLTRRKNAALRGVFDLDRSPSKLVQETDYANLHLLPADESIRTLDRQFDRIGKRKRLAKLVEGLRKDYDRVIFDCPPVMNEVSEQIMRAADLVIVPLPPSPLFLTRARSGGGRGKGIRQEPPSHFARLCLWSTCGALFTRRPALHNRNGQSCRWPARLSNVRLRKSQWALLPRVRRLRAPFGQLWTAIERKLANG